MFINEYPYTDFNELNLDWILKKVKELAETVAEYEGLASEEYVQEQIAALNSELTALINTKVDSSEYNNFVAEVQLSLTSIGDAIEQLQSDTTANAQAIIDTYNELKAYIDEQVIDLQLINPFTGLTENAQAVINYMANLIRSDSLTAEEYDNAQLTAQAYDLLQLTAYQYDNYGKQYIS